MDWIDYREKLGIGFCDKEKENYFFTKAFNLFDGMNHDYMYDQIDSSEYFEFCDTTGTPMVHGGIYTGGYNLILKTLHDHTTNIEDFLAYYMVFVNCQKDKPDKNWTKEKFKNVICQMLGNSHIPYEVFKDKDGYFIFPKGAEELDDALVSEPLKWLEAYPDAHKAFIKALKSYSEATEDNASDVADLFRKALETFFQEFFGGGKSLENYKGDYGAHLKTVGIPKEISGNLETLLQAYTNYMNNYAKHRDATSDTLLEYLMYQTGNIIRLLITLKGEK